MPRTRKTLPYDVWVTIAHKLAESSTLEECIEYASVCKAFHDGTQKRLESLKSRHAWDVPSDDPRTVVAEMLFVELLESLDPGQGVWDHEVEEVVRDVYDADIDKEWMHDRAKATARGFLGTHCSFCGECFRHFPRDDVVFLGTPRFSEVCKTCLK